MKILKESKIGEEGNLKKENESLKEEIEKLKKQVKEISRKDTSFKDFKVVYFYFWKFIDFLGKI